MNCKSKSTSGAFMICPENTRVTNSRRSLRIVIVVMVMFCVLRCDDHFVFCDAMITSVQSL